ncbi:MAG: hypothetical protein H6709_09515 [Kofleriaceae bacterium]|nr:hypothetical protein [Myxococcales bacterium]MCB9561591.1 hypothetical protein [Kofleriaceae bacterium]MCB9572309.1 hypothetical protein [Kofleriaceae bacterium]
MRLPLLVTCGALALGACGDDEVTTDAPVAGVDARAIDARGCLSLWKVRADVGAGAAITGGALVLTATDMDAGSALEVTQTGLTGDFDATFTVSDFTAAGTGAFVQAAVSEAVAQPTQIFTAGLGTFPTVGLGVADQPSGTADLQATALTAATLRFQRTGSDVTVTATAADATASITGTSNAATLQLGVQLGSNMGAVTGDTRAVIDGFVVTGAGVTSDTFDCDSLLPQL